MLSASPLSWERWEAINVFADAKHKSLGHWEMMIIDDLWGMKDVPPGVPENMIKIACTAGCSSQFFLMAVASRMSCLVHAEGLQ